MLSIPQKIWKDKVQKLSNSCTKWSVLHALIHVSINCGIHQERGQKEPDTDLPVSGSMFLASRRREELRYSKCKTHIAGYFELTTEKGTLRIKFSFGQ